MAVTGHTSLAIVYSALPGTREHSRRLRVHCIDSEAWQTFPVNNVSLTTSLTLILVITTTQASGAVRLFTHAVPIETRHFHVWQSIQLFNSWLFTTVFTLINDKAFLYENQHIKHADHSSRFWPEYVIVRHTWKQNTVQ